MSQILPKGSVIPRQEEVGVGSSPGEGHVLIPPSPHDNRQGVTPPGGSEFMSMLAQQAPCSFPGPGHVRIPSELEARQTGYVVPKAPPKEVVAKPKRVVKQGRERWLCPVKKCKWSGSEGGVKFHMTHLHPTVVAREQGKKRTRNLRAAQGFVDTAGPLGGQVG